jgi:hypothetical protein
MCGRGADAPGLPLKASGPGAGKAGRHAARLDLYVARLVAAILGAPPGLLGHGTKRGCGGGDGMAAAAAASETMPQIGLWKEGVVLQDAWS